MKKIDLVQRECQRLQVLLDNFLQFAKAHRLNLQPSDLNAQVRRMLDFYRPKAQEAGVEIVDYLTGDLPTVMLDSEAFHGALLNLVLNAEQAMPQGGQIVIRTYGTADGVALDLIDTGCGMDEETRAKVFDAFFSTKRGGSGLGLPTTRRSSRATAGKSFSKANPAAARNSPSNCPCCRGFPPQSSGRPRITLESLRDPPSHLTSLPILLSPVLILERFFH